MGDDFLAQSLHLPSDFVHWRQGIEHEVGDPGLNESFHDPKAIVTSSTGVPAVIDKGHLELATICQLLLGYAQCLVAIVGDIVEEVDGLSDA